MRLATVRTADGTRAVRIDGDTAWYTDAPDVGALLDADALSSASARPGPLPSPEQLAPLVLSPRKFLCAGLNYFAHAAEMGKSAPEYPTIFSKVATSLVGARDDIVMPAASSALDWEAELVIVIGGTVRRADEASARAAIAGYTILNDVSARDWQKRTSEWFQGKNFDQTSPLGPELVTADAIDPADGLRIECLIDGVPMQDGSTGDLIFDAVDLVRYVSGFLTLQPGDLIATGTPAGVGSGRSPQRYLADGEVVTTRIEGIGELVNRCRAESA